MFVDMIFIRNYFFYIILRVMASSSRCSVCSQDAGTCCPGCEAYFCDEDFMNHRRMLVDGLDELKRDRSELLKKISKTSSQKDSGSSLLSRIDAWQEDTIQKVKQTAQQARQQVSKIINSKREETARQFKTLSQELAQLRETKDVLEQDLSRLKKQSEQLHKDLEELSQPSAIELNMEQSEQIAWHRMIYVVDRSVSATQEQCPSQRRGECLNRF
jgi:DNA repair exonuclease SbcCD ATPase subunit